MINVDMNSDDNAQAQRESRLSRMFGALIPLTFKGQAIVLLFPMIVIISMVYTLESISTERKILRNEIIKKGETIAVIAARNAELPLLSENLEQLKSSALTVMEIKDIAFVSFLNKSSKILLHEGTQRPLKATPVIDLNRTISFSEQPDLFEFIVPVFTIKAGEGLFLLEGTSSAPAVKEQIGWVRIGLSKDVMRKSEHQIIVRGSTLAVIFSTVGLLLLYLFLMLIARPLYALINAVQEIRGGEHSEVKVISPKSEIGRLSIEFNRMSRAIKEREDELKRHRDHLEELVASRTLDLAKANEQLQLELGERRQAEERLQRFSDELIDTNEELKSFAYIVSHDLRAPLVNIKGFSSEVDCSLKEVLPLLEKALTALDGKENERVRIALQEDLPEALEFINFSVNRMDSLINSVLKLSRLGRREIKAEMVQVGAIVDGILRSMGHQLEQRNATVSVLNLPETLVDKTAIEQIIGNLLDNAVKYLDPGRSGSIEISAVAEPNLTTFHIRDNGRGIAKEDMHKVFEIFRRAGRQDTQGEGMGLAYVKTLTRRLGGRLWCESELGIGSVFSFTIPSQTVAEEKADA